MRNIIFAFFFGLTVGLSVAGYTAYAQCCAQLDVPLDYQIEQEYQQLLRESEKPNYPSGRPDAWRSVFMEEPCKR